MDYISFVLSAVQKGTRQHNLEGIINIKIDCAYIRILRDVLYLFTSLETIKSPETLNVTFGTLNTQNKIC